MYSCNWSPNTTHQEYIDFLARLEISLRTSNTEILLTGDFNSQHKDWGSRENNKRREALSNLIHALGLVVYNIGNSPTFHRGVAMSIIDLTITTPRLANKIQKWTMLDTISLSDHFYIYFAINSETTTQHTTRNSNLRKVNCQTLENALKRISIDTDTATLPADTFAGKLTENIKSACEEITPATPPGSRRKSVYWWSTEISNLRRNANHARRVYQRKKKRASLDSSKSE